MMKKTYLVMVVFFYSVISYAGEPKRESGLTIYVFPEKATSLDNTTRTQIQYIISQVHKTVIPPLDRQVFNTPETLINFFKILPYNIHENGIWVIITNLKSYSLDEISSIESLKQLCHKENIPIFFCYESELPNKWRDANSFKLEPNTEEVEKVVHECLTRVKNNIGGWCRTPTVEAAYQLTEMGQQVIPHLISALKKGTYLQIDNFIIEILSSLTCKDFKIDQPRKALIKQINIWWRNNHYRKREDWIFDAIQSTNEKEIQLALSSIQYIKDQRYVPQLVPLIRSQRPDVATTVLYIFWDNFKSQEVLDYVKIMLQEGTMNQKLIALRFVSDKQILSLSPYIIDILQSEKDYGVLSKAINAVLIMSIKESIPILENMDLDQSGKYPKGCIIGALAKLKGKEYKARLLEYLKDGNIEERRGAVENIDLVMDPHDAVQYLFSTLKDPDINIRRYAYIILRQIRSRKTKNDKRKSTCAEINSL